jgi:hypothetical protein
LKEVPVHAGHEALMKVAENCELIVADPQGIVGHQLRPRTNHLGNNAIKNYYL